MKAARGNALARIGEKAFFAAIKMRRASDVEQECILARYAHERRVALRRIGELMKQRAVGIWIGFMHMQRGLQRACGGERHARHQAKRMSMFISRHQHNTAALPGNNDGCRFIQRGGGA
jgi:hypothetical protein